MLVMHSTTASNLSVFRANTSKNTVTVKPSSIFSPPALAMIHLFPRLCFFVVFSSKNIRLQSERCEQVLSKQRRKKKLNKYTHDLYQRLTYLLKFSPWYSYSEHKHGPYGYKDWRSSMEYCTVFAILLSRGYTTINFFDLEETIQSVEITMLI